MRRAAGVAQVTVDGARLPDECSGLLELALVEDHVMLPARFELHFRDPRSTVLAKAGLKISADVAIGVADPDGAVQELVRGDVVALEVEFDASGSRIVARGFDRAHRLARGARTASYRDVTDADVVRTLARRAAVALGRVEDPGVVHATLHQVGVSDWTFLHGRAREVGYSFGMRDGKLDFAPPAPAGDGPEPGDFDSSDPLQLVLGRNLESFRLSLSAAEQVPSVEVRGWDPVRRTAVVAEAQAGSAAVVASASPKQLAAALGASAHADVRASFATQAEVDVAAAAAAQDLGAASVEADGVAAGNPALRAGRAVSIGRVGVDFEGTYMLTATRHRFDEAGYRTQITISGRRDTSLAGLLGERSTAALPERAPGVASGTVSDVGDPDGQGRVKVHLPWLGDDIETDWLRAVQLLAGPGHGAAFLPEVGDEVLVAFERGDIRHGFVLGALFNGVDTARVDDPPLSGGRVQQRGMVTPGGHKLVFVENAPGRVQLVASGDLELEASGRLKLSARNGISIDGGAGNVDITGTLIRLN